MRSAGAKKLYSCVEAGNLFRLGGGNDVWATYARGN